MLSKNTFFQPQFEIINSLLKVINNNQREKMQLGAINQLQIISYIDDRTYLSIIELYDLDIMEHQRSKEYPLDYEVELTMRTYVPNSDDTNSIPFKYQFPSTFKDCYSLSFKWHVPVLLSLFDEFRVILKLVTYIFLERSIIFISKYPAKLSSTILGLKAMI